ncbi:MAG: flavin reductase family protein, partial [Xanthomonadaceae bacterium]|nr:flavin reductase family protein [Xanthomonadaceae bacterium]
AVSPALPRTVHYRGGGRFMVSGGEVSRRRLFRPDMLDA